MIKKIEDMIVGLLNEYSFSGLSEDQLFNYIITRVSTTGETIHLREYKTARANLSERIIEKEITVKGCYGDSENVMGLFLKE